MKKKGIILQELVFSFIFLIMFILINLSIYGNIAKASNKSDRIIKATKYLIDELEEVSITQFADVESMARTQVLPNNSNFYITKSVVEQSNPSSFMIEGINEDLSSAGMISVNLTNYENLIKLVTITISYKLPGQNVYEDISATTIKVNENLIPVEA